MSASPSVPSPADGSIDGRTPTSNNGQTKHMRRQKPADPLRQAKRPVQKTSALKTRPAGHVAKPKTGGLTALNKPGGYIPKNQGPGPATSSEAVGPQTDWSEYAAPGSFTEYPLFTTKRELKEGLRHHVARFQAKKDIDPRNQDEFVRPISLHRRDPRQPGPGKPLRDEEMTEPVDEKERERQEILRAEKEAQRAADLALIAPSGNNASAMAAKKNQSFKNEKTTQIHRIDKTEEDRKQSELRYEEALPWHLEDAEGKQTWVGNYEAALSETNVILVVEGGRFKMVPIEKWYKFTPKNHFRALTIEEAEEQMKKKSKPTRWAMHDEEKQEITRLKQETRKLIGGVYGVKKESASFRNAGKRETEDADDLDFDGDDLFQDDDEQATVEPDNDEDAKEAKDKIKREQLGANMFGDADENDIEKELEKEEREEELRKKLGKSTKKALKKREKNYLYESDSSHNDPFDSNEVRGPGSVFENSLTIGRVILIPLTMRSKRRRTAARRKKPSSKRKERSFLLVLPQKATPHPRVVLASTETLQEEPTTLNVQDHQVFQHQRLVATNRVARSINSSILLLSLLFLHRGQCRPRVQMRRLLVDLLRAVVLEVPQLKVELL